MSKDILGIRSIFKLHCPYMGEFYGVPNPCGPAARTVDTPSVRPLLHDVNVETLDLESSSGSAQRDRQLHPQHVCINTNYRLLLFLL